MDSGRVFLDGAGMVTKKKAGRQGRERYCRVELKTAEEGAPSTGLEAGCYLSKKGSLLSIVQLCPTLPVRARFWFSWK